MKRLIAWLLSWWDTLENDEFEGEECNPDYRPRK